MTVSKEQAREAYDVVAQRRYLTRSMEVACSVLRQFIEQSQDSGHAGVSADSLKVDGLYNWKGQAERLVYIGPAWYPGDLRRWHQFAKVDAPGKVWSEVLDSDLSSFEETRALAAPAPTQPQPQPQPQPTIAFCPFVTVEGARVALTDYLAPSAPACAEKVMAVARREGYTGTQRERLESLGWSIEPLIAALSGAAPTPQPELPLMRAAFRTSVSSGPDKLYEIRFKFPSLDAMQAADREWASLLGAAPTQAVAWARSSELESDEPTVIAPATYARLSADARSEFVPLVVGAVAPTQAPQQPIGQGVFDPSGRILNLTGFLKLTDDLIRKGYRIAPVYTTPPKAPQQPVAAGVKASLPCCPPGEPHDFLCPNAEDAPAGVSVASDDLQQQAAKVCGYLGAAYDGEPRRVIEALVARAFGVPSSDGGQSNG